MLLETFNHQKLSSAIYCNNLNIKLVFSSFKIGNMFGVKDPIPGRLSVHVWFTSKHVQTVNACYVGETVRHFSTCVKEHLASDRASHIFQHLQNSEHWGKFIYYEKRGGGMKILSGDSENFLGT